MKLIQFHITNFQSVFSSNVVETGEITCLVGKNEAGKTSLLKALYRLNPIREEDSNFSVTDDYPRVDVSDYEDDVASGRRAPSEVVQATYSLDDAEVQEVEKVFGPGFLKDRTLSLVKYYDNTRRYTLHTNEGEALKFITRSLPNEIKTQALSASNPTGLAAILTAHAADPAVAAIKSLVDACTGNEFSHFAFNSILKSKEPKFLYFDDYYQMRGSENLNALQQRVTTKTLQPPDQPLLGLIELAKLDLGQMLSPQRTQDLKNKLEGASNHLTRQILPFWSQNKHLQMRFDVRPGLPEDPEGMRDGSNIWGEVYDTLHRASTSLGSRSKGFVWFFSFVAWYSQIKRRQDNVILLLDEPGLTLHGRAQADLLRYFEEQLRPNHQVIYSTHSPFMVDPAKFERVRIVQDLSIDDESLPREEQGTKVIRDVFRASSDSLFPLQGALGYDIHQTLFIGPNTLLVEGPADLLFLNAMSALLERDGREGLSEKWTLTPVGGSGRITTFVRLLTNQKGMKLATLIDIQNNDKSQIEELYKSKLLKKANVRTFGEYTDTSEADIEDMFDEVFYLKILNLEYSSVLKAPLKPADLTSKSSRIIKKIEAYFIKVPLQRGNFSHYRPARYLHENLKDLSKDISEGTKTRFEKAFRDLNGLL